MSIKIEVHRLEESGTCSLSGKDGEVLVLSFSDGTITEAPLSQKALMQLLRMKLQKPKPAAKPEPAAEANGAGGVGAPRPQPAATSAVATAVPPKAAAASSR
jgi:hypothetical protein